MALFDSITKIFSKPAETVQKTVPSGFFSFFGATAMPKMGEAEATKAYTGWVYACVNAIAERVADIEIKLEQKNGKTWERIEDHPSLQLLHNVNDFTSSQSLYFLYEAFQQLNGNSFWYIDYNKRKEPTEIWQLDPTKVQVVKDKDTFIRGYVYTPQSNDPIPLAINEIIHFKRPNPNDPYRGIGTVQAAGIAIDTDKFASEYQRNFFSNSASPSGVVTTPNALTQEQFDRLKMQWDNKFKGIQNAHKVAIMEAGMQWTSTIVTAKEMQFSESRKDLRDEILAIFGVPKPLLGILDDVNLASAQAVEYIFSKYKIKPRMQAFVSGLNEFYLPLWGLDPTKYRLNFVDPIPQNTELELKIIASGRGAGGTNPWMTINEARARFNYEEVENGDELERSTMDIAIDESDQQDDQAHETQDEEEENEQEDGDKSVKKKVTKGKPIERTEASKQQEQDYKAEQIKLLHETYLGLNTKLKKQLLKRLKTYKAVEPERPAMSATTKRLYDMFVKDQVGNSDELVTWLFDTENFKEWVGLVFNATKDGLDRIFETSGAQTLADLNMEGAFDLSNPRAESWLSENALKDSTSYSDTMKADISKVVQEGLAQGYSNEKIADGLSQFFDGQSDYRSLRIARTETMNAYSNGTLNGYYQSEIVDAKAWLPDAEACPICLDNAAAGYIPLDAEFPSGVQSPTAHPNCECSIIGRTNVDA